VKAAAYISVSTELQGDDGYSLEHQERAARAEIANRGWELGVICEEIASATKAPEKRRKLKRLMADLDAGEYDVLLITRLDRLCRSGRDIQNLMHRAHVNDWQLVCLDPPLDLTSPFHKAMAGMAGIWAELESQLISQRTKEGMAAKRARKLSVGGAPPFDDEDTFQTIHRLRTSGRSFRQIADVLNMEGVRAKRGGDWHYSTVNTCYRRWLKVRPRNDESPAVAGPSDAQGA
jgi:DNA invertase Pin-like site-specific DNA recombinase